MESKNLQLVSEKAECLHTSMTVASPEGLRTYGLPVDGDHCLECAWRSFEQAVGKHIEMPPVQIVWWPSEDESLGNWVAECFSWEPAPGESSVIGRGKTVGAAVHQLAAKIRASS
jgi:hypothetical protein